MSHHARRNKRPFSVEGLEARIALSTSDPVASAFGAANAFNAQDPQTLPTQPANYGEWVSQQQFAITGITGGDYNRNGGNSGLPEGTSKAGLGIPQGGP